MPRKIALRLTEPGESVSPLAQIAQGLRLIADALERLPAASGSSQLLTERECLSRYGIGRNALQARGVPRVKCGRAYRWRVSDVEAALVATPAQPRPPKKPQCADELAQLVASGRARL